MVKLGQLVVTAGVNERIANDKKFAHKISRILNRFVNQDWGELDDEDKLMNDLALKNGDDRILASYDIQDGEKVWVITEWDHSVTTVLFPDEY